MRIKIFRADTVTRAMFQIRDELGLDALILSTTNTERGVEVMAALEIDLGDELQDPLPRLLSVGSAGDETFERCDLSDPCYGRHNLPRELMAALKSEETENACSKLFRFGELPLFAGGPPLMLIGPPGAGKTLTVAKLATRLVLEGVNPLVITADDQRAGAIEQLAGFTRLLGLTLIAAGGPETLNRALSRRQADSPVLIDAPSLDLSDQSQTTILADLIAAAGAHTALVLPAGIDPLEAVDVAASHSSLGNRHLLATRLDRNGRLGGILAAAHASGIILTEAGTGTAVANGLERFSPQVLSRRLHQVEEAPVRPALLSPRAAASVRNEQVGPNALAAHIAAQSSNSCSTVWEMIR